MSRATLGAALALLAAAGPALAAPPAAFVSGNWRVDCEFDRMTDKHAVS